MKRYLPGFLSLMVSHSLAMTLVSHSVLLFPPPSRLVWFIAEGLLFAAFWWPIHWLLRLTNTLTRATFAPRERDSILGTAALLGTAVALWWRWDIPDGLWVHSTITANVLGGALLLSHGILAAIMFAALLFITASISSQALSESTDSTASLPCENQKRLPTTAMLSFFVVLLLANGFMVGYLLHEQTIYYWDFSTYWNIATHWADAIHHESIMPLWDEYRHHVQSDDYSPLPATLPAGVMALFGTTRLVYLLAIVNLYFAATAWMTWRLVNLFNTTHSPMSFLIPFLTTLLCPMVWFPIVRGYLDLGGVPLALTAYLLVFRRKPGNLRWHETLCVGALLALILLFRRWYAYFAVAFLFVMMLDVVIASLSDIKDQRYRKAFAKCGTVIGIGAWTVLFLALFAFPWLSRILGTNYSQDYIAYQNPLPFLQRVGIVIDNCGILYGGIVIMSFFTLLMFAETRRIALSVVGMLPIMLYLFLKVSDPGMHHCYLLLPAYLLLPSLALAKRIGNIRPWLHGSLTMVFIAWNAISLYALFWPGGYSTYLALRPAINDFSCYPLVQENRDEYTRLLSETEQAAANIPHGKVAVIASSPTINPTMFLAANRSLHQQLFDPQRIITFPELDRVSPFPTATFESDIIVVAWPPQTHLRVEEQQAVVITATLLHEGTGIGRAFQRLPGEYHLDDDVVAYRYQRTKPIELNDLEDYHQKLKAAHPDKTAFFTPPPDVLSLLKWPR